MQPICTAPVVPARLAVLAATAVAALSLVPTPASADTVVTAPLSVQGMFTNSGQNNGNFNSAPGNLLVGQYADGSIIYHNYFVFDLSSLPAGSATVTSATLTLTTPVHSYISPSPSETWTLYDVSDSSIPTLHDQDAWLQYAVYDDLGAGQTYGSRTVTPADDQTTLSITLDDAALQAIGSHFGSEFVIGGALTTLGDSSDAQLLFNFSDYGTNTTLKLTLGPAAGPVPVPAPASALAGLALLAPLPLVRRRRRRHGRAATA